MCKHPAICMTTPWAPVPCVASASDGSYGSDCSCVSCGSRGSCNSFGSSGCVFSVAAVAPMAPVEHGGPVALPVSVSLTGTLFPCGCRNVSVVPPLSSACDEPSRAYSGRQAQQSHSKKTCHKKQVSVLYRERAGQSRSSTYIHS